MVSPGGISEGILVATGIVTLTTVGFWAYLSRKQWKKTKSITPISMTRQEGFQPEKRVQVLELSQKFRDAHKDWKFYSLGQYLGELQVNILSQDISMKDVPNIIREQIDAALTSALIGALGPAFGTALLPLLGVLPTQGTSGVLFSMISGALISKVSNDNANDQRGFDQGCLPLTMGMLGNGADLYATTNRSYSSKTDTVDLANPKQDAPMGMYRIGEVGYAPSYGHSEENGTLEAGTPIIQNPFIVDRDWEKSLETMENKILKEKGSFDPDSRSLGEPVPINETLLPDLHTGWGDAQATHTQREILRNRLMCCILNRLGHNYHIDSQRLQGKKTPLSKFVLRMDSNGPDITKPHDFVQALIRAGHRIIVCPRSAVTTFGASMCVKNKDGGFYNIPLAFFFQSGYEDKHCQPANFFLPHSGIDMDISGPLVGKRVDGTAAKCNIQTYLAIEGMAGWHSNHNADVPWIKPIDLEAPLTKEGDIVRAAQLCALSAVSLNTVSTDMKLPNGGYGLTGVCNDTAATIETVLYGKTTVHPIVHSGRFMMHTARYTAQLADALSKDKKYADETSSLRKLCSAMMNLPNDQGSTPARAPESLDRMLHMMPPCTHQMTVDAQRIIRELQVELKEFHDGR